MTAKDILKVISKQSFADFYGEVPYDDGSPMSRFLMNEGHDDAPTEKDILEQIKKLFNLKG